MDENSCKYRTGEVFSNLKYQWSFRCALGLNSDFLGNPNP